MSLAEKRQHSAVRSKIYGSDCFHRISPRVCLTFMPTASLFQLDSHSATREQVSLIDMSY
ncbi:BnaC09g41960D [Brassica napus]|uniref:BnaC09g41960D protein n=1 Tax=Brassica napus TaxID=3708 RepID=A0A078GMP5_BRANA|nr:BnaC09g41960D [Brassica napus]